MATTDKLLVIAFLGGMALFGLAMLAVVLRVGPRRGTWNQPAAAFVRPGRRMGAGMYAMAVLHVVAGIVCAVSVPGAGTGVLVVLVAMAAFYVLCAHSFSVASRVAHRRTTRLHDVSDEPPVAPAA